MSGELTKKEAQAQQVQQQSASQGARDVSTQEHHAKASASGGLNLNLFGALSGALSSKSKKTTHTNADGSSTSVEDRHDKGEPDHPRLNLPIDSDFILCTSMLPANHPRPSPLSRSEAFLTH